MKKFLKITANKVLRRVVSTVLSFSFILAILYYLIMARASSNYDIKAQVPADTRHTELKNYCEGRFFRHKDRTIYEVRNCEMYWLMEISKSFKR